MSADNGIVTIDAIAAGMTVAGLVNHLTYLVDETSPARLADQDKWQHNSSCAQIRRVIAQIREQMPKPKPAEPTGLGAVVEDAEGMHWIKIDEHAACNDWTKIGAPSHDDPEQAKGGSVRWFYDQIDAVRVLSEGWSE
jgi:hypothetical protein